MFLVSIIVVGCFTGIYSQTVSVEEIMIDTLTIDTLVTDLNTSLNDLAILVASHQKTLGWEEEIESKEINDYFLPKHDSFLTRTDIESCVVSIKFVLLKMEMLGYSPTNSNQIDSLLMSAEKFIKSD
ncbi:hypothetical protein ISS06_02735 [Patescibacteria group bacterium]|nr:hypothetical protein [Patescibacteria group bacterium]